MTVPISDDRRLSVRSREEFEQATGRLEQPRGAKLEGRGLGTQGQAARALTRAGKNLEHIRANEARLAYFLQSFSQLPQGTLRRGALMCLGFDRDTASGLDLRLANGWPVFRNGRAAMHKRPPLSLSEASATLGRRADQLKVMARAAGELSLDQALAHIGRLQGAQQGESNVATAAWDSLTTFSSLSRVGSLGSLALALDADQDNERTMFFMRLMACTEAMDLPQFRNIQGNYLNQYGANRAAVLASPLPFGGTAVAALATIDQAPKNSIEHIPALWQLIERAADH